MWYNRLRKPSKPNDIKGIRMNYDEWVSYYRPYTNHLDEHASFEGKMFETYGAEVEYVKAFDYNRVWTFISDAYGDRIEPGLRVVDRLGYFLTDEPWLEAGEGCVLSLDNAEVA